MGVASIKGGMEGLAAGRPVVRSGSHAEQPQMDPAQPTIADSHSSLRFGLEGRLRAGGEGVDLGGLASANDYRAGDAGVEQGEEGGLRGDGLRSA